MVDKGKLGLLLEELLKNSEKPGCFEAFHLEARIAPLLLGRLQKGEVPHQVFLEICEISLDAFKESTPHNLTENPAAPILLTYLLLAFSRYVKDIEAATQEPKTAKRREFLADSFGMTGKSGGITTEDQRMTICNAFLNSLDESRENGLLPTSQEAITSAKRSAYKAHHGEDWIKDDDTANSRMTVIKNILDEEGNFPEGVK